MPLIPQDHNLAGDAGSASPTPGTAISRSAGAGAGSATTTNAGSAADPHAKLERMAQAEALDQIRRDAGPCVPLLPAIVLSGASCAR